MKASPLTLGTVALALALATAPEARADLIPWMYAWTASPGPTTTPDRINADAPGTGYITLTDEPLRTAVGESDIVATNLRAHSTAPANAPDRFTNAGYNLGLYLYDIESGQDTTLMFTGVLNGTISAGSSNIKNTFTGITAYSVVLGSNRYDVSITAYTPPSIPGASNPGSIGAHADVIVSPVLAQVPEPATLALAGLGVGVLAVARLRRRRPAVQAGA